MPGLYRETEFTAGEIATSIDMNIMEQMIAMAFDQEIIDNEGIAFVFDDAEDAFEFTPAADNTIIDQSNENGSDYHSLEDIYYRQKISLMKSSVYKAYVMLRNDSSNTISTTFELRAPDLTDEQGTIYGTVTIEVPPDGPGSEYTLPFYVDHLPAGDYYLVAKRTNYEGVQIKYDTSGTYGGYLSESIDDYEYDELGEDLWFRIEYGNSSTFDINGSVAQLGGQKVQNIDTHVTLTSGSSYGDRVDIACLAKDGYVYIVSSDVSNDPEDPDIPFGQLPLARIYIPKNVTDARVMDIEQDDTLGKYRLRRIYERMRRVEKHLQYVVDYNTVERIKYTVEPCDIDPYHAESETYGEGTFNVECTDGEYMLSDTETVKQIWTLLDDSNIDVTNSATTERNHTEGTAKLILNTTTTEATDDQAIWLGGTDAPPSFYVGKGLHGGDHLKAYADGKTMSYYPALYFYCWNEGPLSYSQIDVEFYKNVDYVYYVLFKCSNTTSIGTDYPELVEVSEPYQIHGNPKWRQNYTYYGNGSVQYQQGDVSPAPDGVFSGTNWITRGMYLLVLAMVPLNKSKPAECWTNTYVPVNYTTYPYMKYTNYAVYSGWYPMKTVVVDSGNQRLGIVENKRSNSYTQSGTLISYIPGQEATTTYAYQSPGVLQSSSISTDYGIASVKMNMNTKLPEDTYYTLEVSNDGGTTFYAMQGNTHTFTTQTGQEFVFRLTLYSNDSSKTPTIYYDENKGYAIKATLNLTGGSITDGCLVTEPFNGNQIIKDVLKITTDQFSHWQWVRVWGDSPKNEDEFEEEQRSMYIDIEASDDGVNWFKKVSSLVLDDFYHGSIDYSDYEGSYDEDEYNYNLDVDFDTETNTIEVDDMSTELTSYDTDSIVTSTTTIDSINVTDMEVQTDVGAYDCLAFKNLSDMTVDDFDLSDYQQIHMYLTSDTEIGEGDLELCLYDEELVAESNIPEPIEVWPLPQLAVDTDDLVQVVFQLQSPISELRDFQSIGIRINRTEDPETEATILPFHLYIGPIEVIASDDYPLYEEYLRLRICMHRELASIESPSIRLIGVVPVIT